MTPAAGAALTLVLALVAGPAAAQRQPTFHGAWSGGPADCGDPFRFDERTYKAPGAAPLRVLRVRRDGRSFRLELESGEAVLLTPKARYMLWESPARGELFELRRCG